MSARFLEFLFYDIADDQNDPDQPQKKLEEAAELSTDLYNFSTCSCWGSVGGK